MSAQQYYKQPPNFHMKKHFTRSITDNQLEFLQKKLPNGLSFQPLFEENKKRIRSVKKIEDGFIEQFEDDINQFKSVPFKIKRKGEKSQEEPSPEKLKSKAGRKKKINSQSSIQKVSCKLSPSKQTPNSEEEKEFLHKKISRKTCAKEMRLNEVKKFRTPEGQKKKLHLNIEQCLGFLERLLAFNASWPFRKPIDPEEQGVLTYFDIIKEPMDLKTIGKNLIQRIYKSNSQFHSDIKKIITNSYTFNSPNSIYYSLTKQFETEYLKECQLFLQDPEKFQVKEEMFKFINFIQHQGIYTKKDILKRKKIMKDKQRQIEMKIEIERVREKEREEKREKERQKEKEKESYFEKKIEKEKKEKQRKQRKKQKQLQATNYSEKIQNVCELEKDKISKQFQTPQIKVEAKETQKVKQRQLKKQKKKEEKQKIKQQKSKEQQSQNQKQHPRNPYLLKESKAQFEKMNFFERETFMSKIFQLSSQGIKLLVDIVNEEKDMEQNTLEIDFAKLSKEKIEKCKQFLNILEV